MVTVQAKVEFNIEPNLCVDKLRPYKGKSLDDLLEKASILRGLEKDTGLINILEFQAVYNIHSGEWTGQLYDRLNGVRRSLYDTG